MKKRFAVLLSMILLCSCGTKVDRERPVFHTENIARIVFYTPSAREGIEVPEEDLEEIAVWLSSFTVGEKAGETLIPGSNSISFRMEYEDGIVLENGLSTITVDGTRYYMDHAAAPDSYLELVNP